MMKKRDGVIIACVLVVALALMVLSRALPKTDITTKTADATLAPDAVEYLEPTPSPLPAGTANPAQQPATHAEASGETAQEQASPEPSVQAENEPVQATGEESSAAMVGPMPKAQTAEVRGHVIITMGSRQYGDPIPMDRDKIITVKQDDGKVNKVHITPDSVYMESSTCENQDCVGQGEITLDNYKERILSTFVICLPNQVTIEMVPVQ